MANENDKKFVVDFIDPLFAVAIHIGFTHGLFHERWFIDWRTPTGDTEWLAATSFSLGFFTVLLSWVGYHESIKTKPLKGFWRFLIDVLLVSSYALLLVKYREVGSLVGILVWIFFLFFLWDICKILEYPELYSNDKSFLQKYRREVVTVFWLFLFVILAILHKEISAGYVVLWAWVLTIGYRINKTVPFWGMLWRKLADFGLGRR